MGPAFGAVMIGSVAADIAIAMTAATAPAAGSFIAEAAASFAARFLACTYSSGSAVCFAAVKNCLLFYLFCSAH